jgi:hypothetical protein
VRLLCHDIAMIASHSLSSSLLFTSLLFSLLVFSSLLFSYLRYFAYVFTSIGLHHRCTWFYIRQRCLQLGPQCLISSRGRRCRCTRNRAMLANHHAALRGKDLRASGQLGRLVVFPSRQGIHIFPDILKCTDITDIYYISHIHQSAVPLLSPPILPTLTLTLTLPLPPTPTTILICTYYYH